MTRNPAKYCITMKVWCGLILFSACCALAASHENQTLEFLQESKNQTSEIFQESENQTSELLQESKNQTSELFQESENQEAAWFGSSDGSEALDSAKHQLTSLGEHFDVSGGANKVWAVNDLGEIFFRANVKDKNPRGQGWKKIDGSLSRISVDDRQVWGVDSDGKIWYRTGLYESPEGAEWKKLTDYQSEHVVFADVAAGGDKVWAVSKVGNVYARMGITADHREGHHWRRIVGLKLTSISADCGHHVWGVDRKGAVYMVSGISFINPFGTTWKQVKDDLVFADISVDNDKVWAVTDGGDVYYREGISDRRPEGKKWRIIPGKLSHVSVNRNQAWGVDRNGRIKYRIGISDVHPIGTSWKTINDFE